MLLVLGTRLGGTTEPPAPARATPATLAVSAIHPPLVDPLGGTSVLVRGSGLAAVTDLTIGGAPVTDLVAVDDGTLSARSGPVPPGRNLDVIATRGVEQTTLAGAVEAWSPAEIPGARLFDAASGVQGSTVASSYEWQRLTTEIAPDWIPRDGNTLAYLPATGRFWMVGGWNPYPAPDGFDDVDPASGLPPRITTNEVWSTGDGVRWRKELPDGHAQFDRRHAHATLAWRDRLWIVGGDFWLGRYNHDVVSSADGTSWTVELAQTPWEDRALLVAGVYDDSLWVMGGQTLDGPREDFVYHNDVWRSDDGVHWVQVAADAPPSATRWSGRGIFNELVEFAGRMWLIGGGRYRDDAVGSSFLPEVWSSSDGVTWQQHAAPPWRGRIWHDVRVFDGKLWVLAGGSEIGNLNETWFSADGDTWTALAPERDIHPPSHAQGVAVGSDFLLYAGGNYSFGVGPTIRDTDRSAWRLQAFRGVAVDSWTDRGADAVVVSATGDARPVLDPDALGPGIPGLQFDGWASVLELAAPELQPGGRSVFWIGRAPWMPTPPDWATPPVLNPLWTVVGDGDAQYCAAGLADGRLHYTSSSAPDGWAAATFGSGLQQHQGEVRFAGLTHSADGRVQGWIDGVATGSPIDVGYSPFHGCSRIGAGGYAPVASTAYAGTLGAVLILPTAVDAATVDRIHRWAQGRFSTPPCSSAARPVLQVSGIGSPAGVQRFKLGGKLPVAALPSTSVDPSRDGLRIEIRDGDGNPVFDETLPPGPFDVATRTGWKSNRAGTSFTFVDPLGIAGVTRATVRVGRPTHGRREVDLRANGRTALALTTSSLPLGARLALAAGVDGGTCADLRFRGTSPPGCTAARSTISCR